MKKQDMYKAEKKPARWEILRIVRCLAKVVNLKSTCRKNVMTR